MSKIFKSMGVTVAIAGSLLIGVPAFAAGEGFYIDASVGRQKANISDLTGATKDNTSTTTSVGAGYQVNKNFGIEIGYQDLGGVSYSWTAAGTLRSGSNTFTGTGTAKTTIEVDGFYIGPTFSLPINDKFSVNARAGLYRWEALLKAVVTATGTLNGTAIAANGSASATATGTDAYFGIGSTYHLTKNVGVNLSYTQYKVTDKNAKNLALGLRYSF